MALAQVPVQVVVQVLVQVLVQAPPRAAVVVRCA
jgi:hypothetical protein